MRIMARRPLSGVLTAVGGVCALVIGMAAVDDRVREQVMRLTRGEAPTGEVGDVGAQRGVLASVVAQGVHDQSIAHAPMVMFAVAGTVLVVFMLRIRT